MDEMIVMTNAPPDCEYFCRGCGQLRLSYLFETYKCGNCGSGDIVKGEPGELDKEALIKEVQDGP